VTWIQAISWRSLADAHPEAFKGLEAEPQARSERGGLLFPELVSRLCGTSASAAAAKVVTTAATTATTLLITDTEAFRSIANGRNAHFRSGNALAS